MVPCFPEDSAVVGRWLITVWFVLQTVPVSRRDERLSRSIAQQREQRHAMQARYREDYAAKSFASAVKETVYSPPMARVSLQQTTVCLEVCWCAQQICPLE